LEVEEGDSVTITFAASGITSNPLALISSPQTSFGGTATQGQDYTGSTAGGEVVWPLTRISEADRPLRAFHTYDITDDDMPEPAETITLAVPAPVTVIVGSGTYTTTSTDITITIRASDGYVAPVDPVTPPVVTPGPAPGPGTDNPAARAERLDAPASAVARGVGQLAAHAIQQRLTARTAANALTVAGRNIADSETLAAESTLETSVTSVHPYLSRRINGSQLWLTAGYGSGDAELKEPDALIKTDITITTAAFGIAHARGDLFTAGLSAQYNRAKLDAATGDGKTLPATTADTIRLTASGEAGWTHGAWRPFLNFALRHDSGDGNTGGAADLGGGVEWQTPTVLVRLAGSGHIQGQAADEQSATLTVRKSTGNFDLNLNLAADDAGVDTARLLHGEWRF